MSLLAGFRVVEIGEGLAAAVCGRLFADVGADVACIDPDNSTLLADYLNHGKRIVADDPVEAISAADLIVGEGRPQDLSARGYDAAGLRRLNAKAALGAVIDVSIREALATLAATELARAGLTGKIWSRRRLTDGNGATVTILPARDGYATISPREDRQWAAWLEVMGSPDWAADPRFARKPDRVANWDALHALISAWSRRYDKQSIADKAQAAHVPSFPLREPAEQLNSTQLAHRSFWRPFDIRGQTIQAPGPPFGLRITAAGHRERRPVGRMPLSGIRVLDFSWVIAGPTATRYLAAMGAEVIKIEAPGRGDPGRASELHTVLGQAKRSVVLDLKKAEAVAVARELAAKSDVLIENFATGVMDRLGLGAETLRAANPDLIYVSASGLGRTGP